MLQRVLVWDVPTRVFHWSLVLSFAGAYLTAETERYRDVHLALGYVFLGLIAFRLLWGVVGTTYARFGSFWFGLGQVKAYLRALLSKHPQHYLGHNPAGAIAIFVLLGLGLVIGISGLGLDLAWGDEDLWEELHEIAANLMLLVVLVHIAGVLVSSHLHQENLVRAMLTGFKQGEPAAAISRRYAGLGLLMVIAIGGFLIAYLNKAF